MEAAMLILSVVAIALSIFAIIVSWVLYNKTDALNSEVRDFVVEIRTVTGKMYTDSFRLVKQSYEKFISRGFGESQGLVNDKIVTDIIDNVSNKVEEKLILELEKIKTGENIRDDEIDRLKSDLENIIKNIPAQVDESKKSKMNAIKSEIIDIVQENIGISPNGILNHISLDGDYGKNIILDALIELSYEGYIVGEKGIQDVGFDEPMKVTGKKLIG